MTKQLVAPLCCERTPVVCSDPRFPNYTVMSTCHYSNWGGLFTLSRMLWGWAEGWRNGIKSGVDFGAKQWFLSGTGPVCFSATPGPGHRRWGPSPLSGPTWSKANRWAWIVSHLLGCQLPLARSKNLLGGLKTPTNSYQLGIVFRSDLARSLAS